jgi:hypothetical protein
MARKNVQMEKLKHGDLYKKKKTSSTYVIMKCFWIEKKIQQIISRVCLKVEKEFE